MSRALVQNYNLNFRHARDQVVDLETPQISQGAVTSDEQNKDLLYLRPSSDAELFMSRT